MDLKQLSELRQSLVDEFDTINTAAGTEKRSFTEDEDKRLEEIRGEIAKTDQDIERVQFLTEQRDKQDKLNTDLDKAGITRHYNTGEGTQQASQDDEKTFKRFSFVKFLRDASGPSGLEGVEKEMHQEAKIEARNNSLEIRNFGIPAALLRSPLKLAT